MSAIWGAVAFDNTTLPADLGAKMKSCYEKCVIDNFRDYQDASSLFGCGIQFITKESIEEVLPIIDEESQTSFAADIMLDNGLELLTKLGMAVDGQIIPDGTIAYEMFKRYGQDCLNDLLGAYSFVYYDKKQRKVTMVLDATGNRCLYYSIKEGVLYFSTLIEPLLEIGCSKGINERWITDFLALDNLAVRTEYEETPYLGIYRLAPRQVVSFDERGLTKRKYWQPSVRELCLNSDEEYAARLMEIYKTSVTCLLRAEKNSLLLSGGLDSTSVACIAAPELARQGKTLYTYTSVPEADYISNRSSYYVTNESEGVLKTKEYLEAKGCFLECKFLDLAGINGWDSRVLEMNGLEFPYKSIQNLQWIVSSLRVAYSSGSRLLLDAGFGNISISAQGIDIFLNHLLEKKRFVTFAKQFHRFSREVKHSRKRELKLMLKAVKTYFIKPKLDDSDQGLFNASFITPEMLDKHQTRQRFLAFAQDTLLKTRSFEEYQKLTVHDLMFSQIGEIYTKHSLLTGTLQRDPCMDKRLIEYCMSLPANQFARDGTGKRLVRVYMADIMPEHVTQPNQEGIQSADTLNRIGRCWGRIYQEILKIYQDNINSPYVDCKRAIAELEKMQGSIQTTQSFDFLRISYTAMTLEFISQAEKRTAKV